MNGGSENMDLFSGYDSQIESMDRSKGGVDKHMPAIVYYGLKLNGEAGEVAEKIGKLYRDHDGKITKEIAHDILLELGDCLWYIARIAKALGFSLGRVALDNVLKLRRRRALGKDTAGELAASIERSEAA